MIIKLVVKSMAAVEKLAGNINPQTIKTGIIIGINASLKSFICSCRFESNLAKYIINASLAKSDVWKVWFITGITNHLLASLIFAPVKSVNNNSGIDR